jgi:regulator of cell morphogenesis and NO signaling
MLITKNNKMGDIILHDHQLLSVLSRFEIKLGFKEKTVEEVCKEYNINTDFFLEIANAFHDKNFFTEKKLKSFSSKLIIDYLIKSHDFYLKKKVPEIEKLINSIEYDDENIKFLQLVRKFFNEYVLELNQHINREEETVYPYVIELENILNDKKITENQYKKIKSKLILKYKEDHDNIEEKLYDLKNIIIKYLPPPLNSDVCNVIIAKLFRLEEDLNNHSNIENKVMIPSANEMEKEIEKQVLNGKIKVI